MMITFDENTQEKPEIDYPRRWGFKIIGRDRQALLSCIKEVMGDKKHLCSVGNASKTGKFHSYNASCEVESQEERDRLFKCFQEHADVQFVI
jgi:putative lipoic acid-binding regulatory protein